MREKEMKKKVISLMLVATMGLSLAACGNTNTDPRAAADTSAKAEQTGASELSLIHIQMCIRDSMSPSHYDLKGLLEVQASMNRVR